MQPHQQRVVDERAELNDKINSLVLFGEGEVFRSLPEAEQVRMQFQANVMVLYANVLRERINAFEVAA